MAKKATFDDFLAKKLQRDAGRNQIHEIYVSSMDRSITLKHPTDTLLLETMDAIGDGSNNERSFGAFKRLIYLCCEELQNPKLQKELEISDPVDTVGAVFDIFDLSEIIEQISAAFGFGGVEDRVKN